MLSSRVSQSVCLSVCVSQVGVLLYSGYIECRRFAATAATVTSQQHDVVVASTSAFVTSHLLHAHHCAHCTCIFTNALRFRYIFCEPK